MVLRRIGLVALAILIAAPLSTRAADDKPNIVFFMLDEWGYYEWSHMGHPVFETPNFDTFAEEGTRFTQMLAGGSVCAPTRCSLLTGKHGGHITVRANGGASAIRRDEKTLASFLKDEGYTCGGFGKWGIGARGTSGVPELHGFDTFFGYYHQAHAHTYYPAYLLKNSEPIPLPGNTDHFHNGRIFSQSLIHGQAMQFIRDNEDGPFFAYLPYILPHGQWAMPENDPAYQKYKDRDFGGTNQKGEKDQQIYAAMIELADRQLGEIMALLKELGIDDNTIVMISGDNGGQAYFKNENHPDGVFRPNVNPKTGVRFRGGKGQFYEGGLRVPFVARWPGKIPAGIISNHLCYFPDILPTLIELTGGFPPRDLDGISIVPSLLGGEAAGRDQPEHEFLYWEMNDQRAIRKDHWKAVKPSHDQPWELYDLRTDLSEENDISKDRSNILLELISNADSAHDPIRPGTIYDPDLAFKKSR
ncbi:MAG: arylsulfatase [Verrucomicrobiota bacterium]